MPKYKPLTYKNVVRILRNLGFIQSTSKSTSHQTWILKRKGKYYAVTVSFHGFNEEYKRGTLGSIIRQSGFSKDKFYNALKKKNE